MTIKIRTTGIEDYLEGGEAFVKALILGKPKVGKTRSAAFWPKPMLLDADRGRMSVADLKIPYATLDDPRTASSDVIDLLDHLKRDAAQPRDKRKYLTFIVDTFDSMQRAIIQERLIQTGNSGLSGWEDWGWLDAKMQAIMERLMNLQINVVVNVHTQTKQEGDDGPTFTEPALKGNIRSAIAGDFDLVGNMGTYWEAVEGERVMKRAIWWSPQPGFEILGDRSGTFPAMTEVNFDPGDYTQLFEPMKAKAALLTGGEAFDEVPQAKAAAPAAPDVQGGPVTPARTSVAPPPAKKAAAAPQPAPEATAHRAAPAAPAKKAAAAPAMEVEESGAESVPAAPAPTEATTPVVAAPTTEPSVEEAVETVKETLGGEVVSDTKPADTSPAAPAATGEPPLICGTPGPLRSGELNPAPVPGCGSNIREIATSKEAKDTVNLAFMRTRTFLCPPCFAAFQAAQGAN